MYKIEKNVPFESTSKYPFAKMIPGDSFFVKGNDVTVQLIRTHLSLYKKKANPKHTYKTRKVDGGIRVWCF